MELKFSGKIIKQVNNRFNLSDSLYYQISCFLFQKEKLARIVNKINCSVLKTINSDVYMRDAF
jgi:hypothetical protein